MVLKHSKKILVSRTLKEIEKLLEGHGFFEGSSFPFDQPQ
ncbi:hypothetical protein [Algoriphagus boritolerans]